MSAQRFQIGEIAHRVGLSLRTVRYYEEMGLIVPADRTEGGFRLYTEDHVERLLLIKEMKPLGFTVQEIHDLLEAHDVLADGASDGPARQVATQRLKAFAATTAERVEELRTRLERAEAFAEQLRRRTLRQPGI